MIIKTIAFFLLIFAHLSFAQENLHVSDEELAQNKAYNQALYAYLRHHSSPKIQLIGYSSFMADDEMDVEAIKKILDQAINTSSDEQTLFLADNLCHTEKNLENWCHKKQIHQVHQQVDPENIMTYVNELHNEKIATAWLDLVANQGTYSNSFLFELSLILSKEIVLFNEENPSFLFNQDKEETLSLVKELRLIEKGLLEQSFVENYHESLSYMMSMGIMMAQPVSMRKFSKFCKNNEFYEQCYQIAEVLKTDKTFMGQMMADAISRKINGITKPNTVGTKSYQMASCFSQSQDLLLGQALNPDFAKQYLLDAIEYGEGQAIGNLAFKVYDTVRSHGFNPDFNPHDCEKKLKRIN